MCLLQKSHIWVFEVARAYIYLICSVWALCADGAVETLSLQDGIFSIVILS